MPEKEEEPTNNPTEEPQQETDQPKEGGAEPTKPWSRD
jgi:hypothetical protein